MSDSEFVKAYMEDMARGIARLPKLYTDWRALWGGKFTTFVDKPPHPAAELLGLRPEDVRKVTVHMDTAFPRTREELMQWWDDYCDEHFTEVLMGFEVKDSGERQQFESGMQRDVTTGKPRFDLVFDGPLIERLATHLTKGAVKYEARNWMKATGNAEAERFKESAVRHFVQWMRGDRDEDHFAAVVFNMNGYEYVQAKWAAAQKKYNDEARDLLGGTPCA